MTADTAIIRQQLEAVSKAFTDQLPERGAEIARCWSDVKASKNNPQLIEGLYRLTHNLAGAGGTFGYPGITAVAREVAGPLRMVLKKTPRELSAEESARLEQPLQLLVRLCAHPAEATGQECVPLPADATVHRQGLYYLYGESSPEMVQLTAELQCLGCETQLFTSPSELDQAITESVPAVVLVEPPFDGRHSGLELAALPRPLFIALADRDDFDLRLAAVRSGMDGFVVRPVHAGHLLGYVDLLRGYERTDPFRILIVDDDQRQAEYAAIVLRQAGMVARVVHHPKDLLARLQGFNPELLLVDVYMPKCSGFELAAIVRQMDKYTTVPIIFMSIEPETESQFRALHLGATAYLAKPLQPPELGAMVRSMLVRNKFQSDTASGCRVVETGQRS